MSDVKNPPASTLDSIPALLNRLRDRLSVPEILAITGQVVVWIRHRTLPKVVNQLVELGKPGGSITGPEFRSIVQTIEQHANSPDETFTHAVNIRYEEIVPAELRALVLELRHGVWSEPAELAETLVRWWSDASRSPSSGLMTIPAEIAHAMLQLASLPKHAEVLCVGETAEMAVIECLRQHHVPKVVTPRLPLMAQLYALLTQGSLSISLHAPDVEAAAKQLREEQSTHIIAMPAFGAKIRKPRAQPWLEDDLALRTSEAIILESVARATRGISVVLVPNGILFKSGGEQRLRQRLVDAGLLRAVISFPPGLLDNTSMPFSLLVLDSRSASQDVVLCEIDAMHHVSRLPGMLKHHDRRFTGETALMAALRKPVEPWCRGVNQDELATHDYNLSVNRYLKSGTSQNPQRLRKFHTKFGDIAEIIKPQALRPAVADDGVSIGEISPGEMPPFGYVRTANRKRHVDRGELQRLERQFLRANDVLLSTKGTIGRSGIAQPANTHRIAAAQSILILRLLPRSPIRNPEILLMYLRSPYFQERLRSIVIGTTIPNVALADLRNLDVAIPTEQQQNALLSAFEAQFALQTQLDELVKQQNEISKAAWSNAGLEVSEGVA